MIKLKTLAEKQSIRYRMVYLAFGALLILPFAAIGVTFIGMDPSSAAGIVATGCATLGAIVIAHFSTTPRDDNASS